MLNELAEYRAERNRREGTDYDKLTTQERDKALSTLLMHCMEELVELVMCVNRKSWKPLPSLITDSGMREKALEELADVLLMLHAFADAAGLTEGEVQVALLRKMAKNLSRQDHSCNQTGNETNGSHD